MSKKRRHTHPELTADQVRRRCDPAALSGLRTGETLGGGMLGQDRALGAINLGVSLRERGFNIFVAGPPARAAFGELTGVPETAAQAASLVDRIIGCCARDTRTIVIRPPM